MTGILAISFFAAVAFFLFFDWFIRELSFAQKDAHDAAMEFSLAAAIFFGVAVFVTLTEYM